MHPHGSSLGPHSLIPSHVSWALLCVSLIAPTPRFTSSSSSFSLWSTCSSFCPSTSSSRMWWTNFLCNSAEDLGTLAENQPPITTTTTGQRMWTIPLEYHALASQAVSSIELPSANDGEWTGEVCRWWAVSRFDARWEQASTVEDIPLRWNRCRHHLREECCLITLFCGNSLNLFWCRLWWDDFGATWHMARDVTWTHVDASWYWPESCGFPDSVADWDLVPCRLVDLTAWQQTCGHTLTESAHVESSGSNHFEWENVSSHCFTLKLWWGCFQYPGQSTAGFRVCVRKHQEAGAKQIKTQQRDLKNGVKTFRVKEVVRNYNEVLKISLTGRGHTLPQYANLSSSTLDAKTNVLIWRLCRQRWSVFSSSRTPTPRELGCIQEH